jgi:hypothetical protein
VSMIRHLWLFVDARAKGTDGARNGGESEASIKEPTRGRSRVCPRLFVIFGRS